jgi:ADP-ribose pyrophosphatase
MTSIADARVIVSTTLLDSPKRFVHDRLELLGGERFDWFYQDTPRSVIVVPRVAGGGYVLVRQIRWNLRRRTTEFPAGTVRDGEDPAAAALRELLQKTGYAPGPDGRLHHAGSLTCMPSETNRVAKIFIARPVQKVAEPKPATATGRLFDMVAVVLSDGQIAGQLGHQISGAEPIAAWYLAQRWLLSRDPREGDRG